MHAGIDFGTSNCLISHSNEGKITHLALSEDHDEMPSAMYVYKPEVASMQASSARFQSMLHERLRSSSIKETDSHLIQQLTDDLQKEIDAASRLRSETVTLLDAIKRFGELRFGYDAIETGLMDDDDGFIVKSPKSFLGSKLGKDRIQLFTEIATCFLEHIKITAEQTTQKDISDVVIGRPVNFHGTSGEAGNEQAVSIIRHAAQKAGFNQIEFMLEPLAAAMDFERTLTEDSTVLVVDIGGGTTDCSILRLGPSFKHREHEVLAHTGSRIGGLDLDIHLAFANLMPYFGKGTMQTNGLPMPVDLFHDACHVNDIPAQRQFMQADLERLLQNAAEPNKFERLLDLRDMRGTIKLIAESEQVKMALSSYPSSTASLEWLEKDFNVNVSADQYAEGVQRQLDMFQRLAKEAVVQAGITPDVVYITGGTAQSPLIRNSLEASLGKIPLVSGNHFASVVSGLSLQAERMFG